MPSHQQRRDPLPPDYQCPTHGVDCDCPSCRKAESFFEREVRDREEALGYITPAIKALWDIHDEAVRRLVAQFPTHFQKAARCGWCGKPHALGGACRATYDDGIVEPDDQGVYHFHPFTPSPDATGEP